MNDAASAPALRPRIDLLYHFCRLQLPSINLTPSECRQHLDRTFELQRAKEAGLTWETYLERLYPLDWFIACGCIEGNERAWEVLFAARAGRTDCLLMDALRARACRLYPRDEERQDSAVQEFWSLMVVPETAKSLPILARYDGQRPLVPWLIRVFQNWHISQLRKHSGVQALPEDDLALPLPTDGATGRWREIFSLATRDWLAELEENDLLLLGLRFRYRLSQREIAQMLKVHEGTISRRTDQMRDRCLNFLQQRLVENGWTGESVFDFVRAEMHHLLLDDSHLSVDHLAQILSKRGVKTTSLSSPA